MSGKLTIQDLESRLVEKTGISRKAAEDWFHAFAAVIEEGLARDGEARVRGMGTFRLKWTGQRMGRNLQTGEPMEIPAHSRVVFSPEVKLKEKINEDFRFLTYQVIEEGQRSAVSSQQETIGSRQQAVSSQQSAVSSQQETVSSQQETVSSQQSAVNSRQETVSSQQETIGSDIPIASSQQPTANGDKPIPPAPGTPRKRIHWLYPLVFFILVILAVIFYFRNCRGPVMFPPFEKPRQEIGPAEASDTVSSQQPAVSSEAERSPDLSGSAVIGKQPTEIITQGTWLFQLAREQYGNPFLWTLIYAENRDRIGDPQKIPDGITLIIPSLEGTGKKLSRNDSLRMAEGYRLVKDYYISKGDAVKADEYGQGISRYNPR